MIAIPPDRIPAAVAGCLEACRRCEEVVDAVVDQDGGRAGRAWHSVGPHLRHCVEHFRVLFDGVPAGRVEYDSRPREARLENDPEAMRVALAQIGASLAALDPRTLAQPLEVTQSAAPGEPPLTSPSCLERELVFLSGHTIHHIAIMGLAAEAVGASVPARLAVAFSTEAHRESAAAAS